MPSKSAKSANPSGSKQTSKRSSSNSVGQNNRIFFTVVCTVAVISFLFLAYNPLKYFYIANRTSGLLNAQLEAVQTRNETIAADIEYYADPSVLEAISRDKLGLAKTGETVLEVPYEPGELTQTTTERFLPPEVSLSDVVESQKSPVTDVFDSFFGFSEHDVFTF